MELNANGYDKGKQNSGDQKRRPDSVYDSFPAIWVTKKIGRSKEYRNRICHEEPVKTVDKSWVRQYMNYQHINQTPKNEPEKCSKRRENNAGSYRR